MDYVAEFDEIIREVSGALGKTLDRRKYEIIDRGVPISPSCYQPEKWASILSGMMGSF